MSFERSADFRYHGQEYVLTIPIADGRIDMEASARDFDAAYERQYGHSSPEGRVELANIRVAAIGTLPRPDNADPDFGEPGDVRHRMVYFSGEERETAIVDRGGLKPGQSPVAPQSSKRELRPR